MYKKVAPKEHSLGNPEDAFGVISETNVLKIDVSKEPQKRLLFLKSIKQPYRFVALQPTPALEGFPLFYNIENKGGKLTLSIIGTLLEINFNLNQATKNVIRKIFKQLVGNDLLKQEAKINIDILKNGLFGIDKNKRCLFAVAIDKDDRPCLIYSINIKKTLTTVPPEAKVIYIKEQIAEDIELTQEEMEFLGISQTIEEMEAILAKIKK